MKKNQAKTRTVWVGNNLVGMKAVTAVVPDEGLLEAKRYLESVHSARNKREMVEIVVQPHKTVHAAVYADGLVPPPLVRF